MKQTDIKIKTAQKVELITQLLNPPIFDENDEIIGYREPLISKEEALELLKRCE